MENPLSNFYRSKEVYVKLPSEYRYFTVKPNVSNDDELGVMPMSSKDEMLLKIPDTLYNGEVLFEIIKSIVPDIVDPYEVTLPDVDIILLATRIATYGKDMDVSVKCPHCNKSGNYAIDIPSLLAKVKPIPANHEIEINSLNVKFKPNSLKTVSANRIASLETQKLARQMSAEDPPETTRLKFKDALERATAANFVLTADTIESVTLPDGSVVSNIDQIIDWMSNTDTKTIKVLKKQGEIVNDNGLQKTFKFVCSNEECEKDFSSSIEFNPAFFFKQE